MKRSRYIESVTWNHQPDSILQLIHSFLQPKIMVSTPSNPYQTVYPREVLVSRRSQLLYDSSPITEQFILDEKGQLIVTDLRTSFTITTLNHVYKSLHKDIMRLQITLTKSLDFRTMLKIIHVLTPRNTLITSRNIPMSIVFPTTHFILSERQQLARLFEIVSKNMIINGIKILECSNYPCGEKSLLLDICSHTNCHIRLYCLRHQPQPRATIANPYDYITCPTCTRPYHSICLQYSNYNEYQQQILHLSTCCKSLITMECK